MLAVKTPTGTRAAGLTSSPDVNPDEAIWAWVSEEVSANTCLGTKAAVHEQRR